MTNYEYIRNLSENDMILFMTYFCVLSGNLLHGVVVTDFKLKLPVHLFKYKNYEGDVKVDGVKDFFQSVYDGESVYECIKSMTINEMSGMFGKLSVSHRARREVLSGGNPVHVLFFRRSENMIEWLNSEVGN